MKSKFFPVNLFKNLGPGIITAALVLGPGSLTVTSKLGAGFQYQLLWLVALTTMFMTIFTLMSARFGLASQQSLIAVIKEKYGKVFSIVIGMGVFIVTVSFQSGNSIGAGLAFAGLFETSAAPWILFFTVVAIAILFFRSFYKILEKIMIVMVAIMLISFLLTLFLSKPGLVSLFSGFSPSVPSGSELLSIALVATGFSIVGAFYQSYLVQEKGWKKQDASSCYREAVTGIIILGLISSMIMVAAGAVLYKEGINVRSAADMGKALEPLFGRYALVVFMLGLFAASFSSLIGNATLGGAVLADTLGFGKNLNALGVRIMIMAVIITGATVALVFSHLQLQLIILAQGFTILFSPLIGIVIYKITTDSMIMGKMKITNWLNIIGIAGLLALIILAVFYVRLLIS